jgi:cytochrome c peroxidase
MKRWVVAIAGLGLFTSCKKGEPDKTEPGRAPQTSATADDSGAAAAAAAAQATPRADEMTLPAGLGKPKIPEDNPQTEAKIALGQQLFFDKRLSGDGKLACYSCHQNADGTGGHDPIAIGAGQKQLTRHSPILYNVGYLPKLYWDGRAGSLEELATGALGGGNMGVGAQNLPQKVQEIAEIPGYKRAFAEVFPDQGATPATLVKALASYMRAIVCDDTDYDRYAAGDKNALNTDQKRGLELFMGKAACVACHTPPHFSSAYIVREGAYFNVGVGFEGKTPEEVDAGRKKISNAAIDFGAFKVPTLRNVTKSAPYFHDGSKATLKEAVRFMASGGFRNPALTPLMVDKKLDAGEIENIVLFLGALECKVALKEPKLP